MKINKITAASVAALATVLVPTPALADVRVSNSHTPIDASSGHVAKVTAEELVAAETQVWRTGNLTAAKSLAMQALDSRLDTSASPEAVSEVLERASMLRRTITDSGFEVTGYTSSDDYRVVTRDGRSVVEVTVIRNWVETDTVTHESTDVGDTDTYRIPLEPTAKSRTLSASPVEIAAEGEQTASEPDTSSEDRLRDLNESETTKPSLSIPEDSDSTSGTVGVTANSFDHTAFANYGKKWTSSPYDGDKKADFNASYPYFKNNCANFVSQMYNKGGWKRTGGVNPRLDGNWDDDLSGPAGPSRTWSQAKELYKYAKNKKGLDPLGNIWNAVPGNTYFMDWDGDNVINHVTAVTARTSRGTPRISQKTANRHNMLLTTWKAKVDGSHPKVKWYGLRRTA